MSPMKRDCCSPISLLITHLCNNAFARKKKATGAIEVVARSVASLPTSSIRISLLLLFVQCKNVTSV